MKKYGLVVLVMAGLASCNVLRESPKTQFKDGYYTQTAPLKSNKVYVDINDEIVNVHGTTKRLNEVVVDTAAKILTYKTEINKNTDQRVVFCKSSLDFDFLTMPLKLRLPQKGVPAQFNANLNGAVYLGYRSDFYTVSYSASPLKKAERSINHYGFSYGLFSGFGNTALNPTTTDKQIVEEYDGVVWSKGIAAIIAVDNFTVGIAAGFDNLLDKNRGYWIYENKPWAGLAFGLNLN